MTLSVAAIKAATPGAILRDDKVPGLHVRVFAERASFYLYFRTKEGVERRPKLGDFPVVPIDKARSIAGAMLVEVATGKDPVADRQRRRDQPTVAELCDIYMKKHGSRKKSAHGDQWLIDRHIKPRPLAKKRVRDVRMLDIEDLRDTLAATPYLANRVLALLSKMFGLAEGWELRDRETNPCAHVQRNREFKRRRYLTIEEAPLLASALLKYGATYPEQAAFLWLLIYTGARPAEIAAARPEQRKGERFEFTEHKTDGNDKLRVVYLPPQAVAVLDQLPRTRNGTITGIASPRHLWRIIYKECGFENLRMYDLRHSFGSNAIEAGLTLAELQDLMGHDNPTTTKRYAHLMQDVAVAKATRIADVTDRRMKVS